MSTPSDERRRVTPGQLVILFQPDAKRPIFHDDEPMAGREGSLLPLADDWVERRSERRTRCGRVLHQLHWVERVWPSHQQVTLEQFDSPYAYLRFDNASAIGRPCKLCFRGDET